jgi:hypothetical protein
MDIVPSQTHTPTRLGNLTVTLQTELDEDAVTMIYAATFAVQVIDQTNTVMRIPQGNLTPFLTAAQKTQIKAFMDAMRVLGNQRILGQA